jgi:hypothetical protein
LVAEGRWEDEVRCKVIEPVIWRLESLFGGRLDAIYEGLGHALRQVVCDSHDPSHAAAIARGQLAHAVFQALYLAYEFAASDEGVALRPAAVAAEDASEEREGVR